MLKLTGNTGKSIVVEAMQEYISTRVYSYDKYMIPTMESYHVDLDDCTMDKFCEFVYQDILGLGNEIYPVNVVIIYTNLQDVKEIENLANKLESEYLARMVIVTSK